MSKLVQRIERLGKDTPAPLGFGAAARRAPAPTMVLMAVTSDAGRVAGLAGAVVDGVLFRGAAAADAKAAAAAMKALPDVPWGAEADALAADEVAALADAGADFVSLATMGSAVDALRDEDVGKLLVVAADMKAEHAHSLEVMPVDAVVNAEASTPPLTLGALMQLAAARCEIGCPYLLPVTGALTVYELECLREIGVEGVVADLDAAVDGVVPALAQAIRDLPRRRPRGDFPSPTLPRVSARPHVHYDDDDPDDPDDFP